MLNIDIQIENGISPDLREKLALLKNSTPLLQKTGEELAKSIRKHFVARDSEGNKHGWPSRHFWSREGRNNTALTSFNDQEAVVSIASEAIGHKVYGGEVRPARGRALAIPASAEAYRAGQPSAMNKDMLEFVPLNAGGLVGMLVERQSDVLRKTKKGFRRGGQRGGNIWFWLMAKVTHAADPRALPPQEELEERVFSVAEAYLHRVLDVVES